jgi:hypothetical protein
LIEIDLDRPSIDNEGDSISNGLGSSIKEYKNITDYFKQKIDAA